MSNEISFIVRALDFTKQGLASAKKNLESFAKGAGSSLGKIFSAGGIATAAAIAFGMLARNIGRWADDIAKAGKGAYSAWEVAGAKAIQSNRHNWSAFFDEMKAKVVGIAGFWTRVLFGPGQETGISQEQLDKDNRDRDDVRRLREHRQSNTEVLDARKAELVEIEKQLAKNSTDNELLKKKETTLNAIFDLEKSISDEKEKQATAAKATQDKIDEKAAEELKAEDEVSQKFEEGKKKQIEKFRGLALDRDARDSARDEIKDKEREDKRFTKLLDRAKKKQSQLDKFGGHGPKLNEQERFALATLHAGDLNAGDGSVGLLGDIKGVLTRIEQKMGEGDFIE